MAETGDGRRDKGRKVKIEKVRKEVGRGQRGEWGILIERRGLLIIKCRLFKKFQNH